MYLFYLLLILLFWEHSNRLKLFALFQSCSTALITVSGLLLYVLYNSEALVVSFKSSFQLKMIILI